jgi:hypothetical protein
VLERDRRLVDVEETIERRVRDPRGAPRRPEQAPSEESGLGHRLVRLAEPSLKGQTNVRFAVTNLRTVVSAETRRVVEEEGPNLVSRGPGERQAVQGQQNAVLAENGGGSPSFCRQGQCRRGLALHIASGGRVAPGATT